MVSFIGSDGSMMVIVVYEVLLLPPEYSSLDSVYNLGIKIQVVKKSLKRSSIRVNFIVINISFKELSSAPN